MACALLLAAAVGCGDDAPEERTLLVQIEVEGDGGVAMPGGATCQDRCALEVTPGQEVRLEAEASAGAEFLGWSGACGGTDACALTVGADVTVRATFAPLCPSPFALLEAGDEVTSAALDAQGGVVFAGRAEAGARVGALSVEGPGAFVGRVDARCRPSWLVSLGPGEVSGLALDASGNALVAGTLGGGPGRAFVAKLAGANGAALWTRAMEGAAGSGQGGVAVDGDGAVWWAGAFEGVAEVEGLVVESRAGVDLFVARLDGADGQARWLRRVGDGGSARLLGVASLSGGVALLGTFEEGLELGALEGVHATFLAALDGRSGEPRWARVLGDGQGGVPGAGALVADGQGVIAASSQRIDGVQEASVVSLEAFSAEGQTRWSTSLVTSGGGAVTAIEALAIHAPGVLVAGGRWAGEGVLGAVSHAASAPEPFAAQWSVDDGGLRQSAFLADGGVGAIRALAVDPEGVVWLGGVLEGTLLLDGAPVSRQALGGFLGRAVGLSP